MVVSVVVIVVVIVVVPLLVDCAIVWLLLADLLVAVAPLLLLPLSKDKY